jgi:hypothetical protein
VRLAGSLSNEEARRLQELIEKNGYGRVLTRATLRRLKHEKLEGYYRTSVEAGNKREILPALKWCLQCDFPIPIWLFNAFVHAMNKIEKHRVCTWDEVFGRATPKGTHRAALEKKLDKSWRVFLSVEDWRERGQKIDFAEIGRRLGLGETLAKEYYSYYRSRVAPGKSAKRGRKKKVANCRETAP